MMEICYIESPREKEQCLFEEEFGIKEDLVIEIVSFKANWLYKWLIDRPCCLSTNEMQTIRNDW